MRVVTSGSYSSGPRERQSTTTLVLPARGSVVRLNSASMSRTTYHLSREVFPAVKSCCAIGSVFNCMDFQ